MMKAFIALNVLGVYAFSEEGRLLARELFNLPPGEIARRLRRAGEGLIPEEERLVASPLLQGYQVILEKPRRVEGHSTQLPNPGGERLRGSLDEVLEELGMDRGDYRRLLHSVALAMAEEELALAFSREDRRIIQEVSCLEDLDEAINLLMERVREWHALSVPSYGELAAEREKLLRKAASGGDEVLRGFAEAVADLLRYRRKLEERVGRDMEELAPNLTALVGPLLGAKLITLAKGLDGLARMPGSRIQILGAGRAFFKGRKKPPKHGIIYQHPLVRGSPRRYRGRISRSLANKIAIAARVDAHSKKPVAEDLRRMLEERIAGMQTGGAGR